MRHLRCVKMQAIQIEEVQIRLVAGCDDPSILKADRTRRIVTEPLHHDRQGQALAARAVADQCVSMKVG